MHILVCDDDLQVCREIKETVQEKYSRITIDITDDINDYYEKLKTKKTQIPDIVIMDIRWDEDDDGNSDGIRMSVKLQTLCPRIKIIFLTGFMHYATDIFEARPSAFLVKPVNKIKLYETIDKLMEEIRTEKSDVLSLQCAGGIVNVRVSDIIYLESNKHELILYMNDGEQHVWMKLEEMMSRLPDGFLRIHQSFAVNANYIQKFGAMNVILRNGKELSVSRSRYKKAKEGFLDHLENM